MKIRWSKLTDVWRKRPDGTTFFILLLLLMLIGQLRQMMCPADPCWRYCDELELSFHGVILRKEYHQVPVLVLEDEHGDERNVLFFYLDLYDTSAVGDIVTKNSGSRWCELRKRNGKAYMFEYLQFDALCDSACKARNPDNQ